MEEEQGMRWGRWTGRSQEEEKDKRGEVGLGGGGEGSTFDFEDDVPPG